MDKREQRFAVSANGFYIEASQGTLINGYKPFVFQDGSPVTGNVELEIIEIYDKASMILCNKPTLAFNNGVYKPLESGGELYIAASKNGIPLKKNPNGILSIKMPVSNTASAPQSNMELFYGADTFGELTWSQSQNQMVTTCSDSGLVTTNYCFDTDSINWINVDKFTNETSPKTKVEVVIPNGYNPKFCSVAISFDGTNTAVPIYEDNNKFESTFELSIGRNVHFIVIIEKNNALEYDIISATIANNHTQNAQFKPVTHQQLITLINNLP